MQSDLDLTLIVDKSTSLEKIDSEILELVKSKLHDIKRRQNFVSSCLITKIFHPYHMSAGALLEVTCSARLPNGKMFNIDVDISINKPLEILNSQLICSYCMLDDRFRKVALVLKNWNRTVDRSKDKRLNSFSIYLLLLVYMLSEKYLINL